MKRVNFDGDKNLLLRWAPDQGYFTRRGIQGGCKEQGKANDKGSIRI